MMLLVVGLVISIYTSVVGAQMVRPPAFMGGVPGLAQMRAGQMQRHQLRTLLYREALDELRQNPRAADLPVCDVGKNLYRVSSGDAVCLYPLDVDVEETAEVEDREAPRKLALLIGNSLYPRPIPELDTPVADIEAIGNILRNRFGFKVTMVKDGTKRKIIDSFNKMAREVRAQDSIVLLYAGHGYLLDKTGQGYWIPVDASVTSAEGWISNSDISHLLSAIRSRQLLLVSDSCFSGTLAEKYQMHRVSGLTADEIMKKKRSVMVLASGGDEPVSDQGREGHSIFAWHLIQSLKMMDGITSGSDVWRTIYQQVRKEYPQEPQYGAVLSAGHSRGGEYFFTAQ